MAIITLTTDLGHKDFYLAALKGSILSQLPQVQIIDISNEVAAFNILQAAFIVKNSYCFFPKRSVHLIGVDSDDMPAGRYLALAYNEHYFIGADNGLFSLVLEQPPTKMVEVSIKADTEFPHFPLKDILVKAACHLANGGILDALGPKTDKMEVKTFLQPVSDSHFLKGSIIYVDDFDNAITNITAKVFDEVRNKRRFRILFRRNEEILGISKHYDDVPTGEKLCLFGISGHLEIAINKGKAASLLGLRLDEAIIVEFFD